MWQAGCSMILIAPSAVVQGCATKSAIALMAGTTSPRERKMFSNLKTKEKLFTYSCGEQTNKFWGCSLQEVPSLGNVKLSWYFVEHKNDLSLSQNTDDSLDWRIV